MHYAKNINLLNVIFVECEDIRVDLSLQRYREKLKYLMFLGSRREKVIGRINKTIRKVMQ
jgi:hypothetical protein